MNDATAKKGGRMAKVLNYGGKSILGLALVLLVAHVAWTNSGSNQWKVVDDKDGIRVATMKTPGYSLLKYKVDMHVENKLSDIVFYLSDLNTGYDAGASDLRRIEQVSSAPLFYVYDTYKLDLKPFGKLDVLILNEYIQDPETKKVSINVYAAPNKEPVDPKVARIVHLSDSFTLTPVATGGVDINVLSEMDLGLPYVLTNLVMPSVMHQEVGKMRELLKKDRYKNRKPAFITELDENPKVANAAR